jgi:hypothetical protein
MLAGTAALLAGGAFAGIGGSPAVANADAELVALCASVESAYGKIHDCYPGGATAIADDAERDAVIDPLYIQAQALLRKTFEIEATSLAGHRARARAIVSYYEIYDEFEDAIRGYGPEGVVIAALVRDLLGKDAT